MVLTRGWDFSPAGLVFDLSRAVFDFKQGGTEVPLPTCGATCLQLAGSTTPERGFVFPLVDTPSRGD